jgi:hypothetical protein
VEGNRPVDTRRDRIQQEAWIGDAVLCLYARMKVLREDAILDGEKSVRMTSNQFLSAAGEPTRVEAEIGRIFAREGLAEAFDWIEKRLMPHFERQETNRRKRLGIPERRGT